MTFPDTLNLNHLISDTGPPPEAGDRAASGDGGENDDTAVSGEKQKDEGQGDGTEGDVVNLLNEDSQPDQNQSGDELPKKQANELANQVQWFPLNCTSNGRTIRLIEYVVTNFSNNL